MTGIYIALGSNEGNPLENLQQALQEISALPNTFIEKKSHFYWNKFIGDSAQNDCLNGVIAIQTKSWPYLLLNQLLAIENKLGRVRQVGKLLGRTLDLDLLLYQNEIIKSESLTLPHPRMCERDFVLFPLLEIAPDLILPSGEIIKEIVGDKTWSNKKLAL